jgi:hypothetical protein
MNHWHVSCGLLAHKNMVADVNSSIGTRLIQQKENSMLGTILIVVVILLVLGTLPTWPHSRQWGYYPSGGFGLICLILIILLLTGRI